MEPTRESISAIDDNSSAEESPRITDDSNKSKKIKPGRKGRTRSGNRRKLRKRPPSGNNAEFNSTTEGQDATLFESNIKNEDEAAFSNLTTQKDDFAISSDSNEYNDTVINVLFVNFEFFKYTNMI